MASLRAETRNPLSNRNTLLLQGIADRVRDEAKKGVLFVISIEETKKIVSLHAKLGFIVYEKYLQRI